MRGTMLAGILFALCQAGFCETLLPPNTKVSFGLIDHLSVHAQRNQDGKNRMSLMTTLVRVGVKETEFETSSVGQLRWGVVGFRNEDNQSKNTRDNLGDLDYTTDLFLNLGPLLRKSYSKYMRPDFEFLNSLEVGPAFSYDFHKRNFYLSLSAGLAFSFNPVR